MTAQIERLRPAAMQSQPVFLDAIFDDPDAILDLIRARAPYPTMAAFHNMPDPAVSGMPWFRTVFDDDVFLNNPRWVEAAKQSFNAEIVRPTRCVLNINAPTANGGAHVDLPAYRGFNAPAAPVWLLMTMTYSGLFNDWMVPIASGLCWFYRGEGGAFEYWPDGPTAPSHRVTQPLWNNGVMSDNEFMWHRVDAIGAPAEQKRYAQLMRYGNTIHADGDGWDIRDGETLIAHAPSEAIRISLLWKANVFKDAAHLASFQRRDMDLDIDQVTEIFLDDLAAKGVDAKRPEDPLNDSAWRQTLTRAYPPAIFEKPLV